MPETIAFPRGISVAHRAFLLAAACLAAGAVFAASLPPTTPVKVHRTWMPEAYPSSYAIGFGSGLNFCFDPIRGNVIYAWAGDYVDLSATVNGKIPRDAVVRGTIFYRVLTESGFSTGSAHPEIRFRGFRLKNDVPEFEYDVDGIRVREAVRPSADGTGLVREFHITTPDRRMTYRGAELGKVQIESGPARWVGDQLELSGNSTVVFSVAIPRQ